MNVNILGQAYNPPDSSGRQSVAPWAGHQLGRGATSIGSGGCIETAMTMAFNAFNPDTPMTPDIANDIMVQKGAFGVNSSMMILKTGANALGMDMPDDQHIQPADVGTIIRILDKALANGGLALLRVYHGSSMSMGDHTVLVHGSSGSGYIAADPALARNVTFDANLRSVDGATWGSRVPYQAIGVAALYDV